MTLKSAYLYLEPNDIKRSDELAVRRMEAAIRVGRQPENNARRSLEQEKIGTRCECAGWLYFHPHCTWRDFLDNPRGMPDLDDFIDVKGRPEHWHDLIVQTDDPPDWAYLLVRAHEHPKYHIVGWCWGREAQTLRVTDPRGLGGGAPGPAHFVQETAPFMKSPGLLFMEQRRRRKMAEEGSRLW